MNRLQDKAHPVPYSDDIELQLTNPSTSTIGVKRADSRTKVVLLPGSKVRRRVKPSGRQSSAVYNPLRIDSIVRKFFGSNRWAGILLDEIGSDSLRRIFLPDTPSLHADLSGSPLPGMRGHPLPQSVRPM